MPRIEPWEQTKTTAHLKKREWNGGIGVCAAMKAPVGLLSHKAVLRKQDGAASPRQTWGLCTLHKPVFHRRFCRSICFSGATWLDLSNLVARTEYHSQLVLSTLILRFFFAKGVCRRDFGIFSTFCPKKAPCFGRKPTCFLLLFKGVLAIIITQDFVGRFSFLSTPCSRGCRNRQFKTVSPPESRLYRAVFQRLVS